MSSRKKTPTPTETAVLTKGARRCPVCYHLYGDLEVKLGQIAHLDQNPANTKEDNLAFLCMPHHSEYDSKTSQHKNYTHAEIIELRSRLYVVIAAGQHHQIKNSIEKFEPEPINEVTKLIVESNDHNVPLSTLLRKAKSIAKKRDDTEMLGWIEHELNGYNDVLVKDLPAYRKSYGEAYALNPFQGWSPIAFESVETKKSCTEISNCQAVGVIEEMYNNNSSGVFKIASNEVEQFLRNSLNYDADVQIRVASSALKTIIEAVRNKIHNWVLKLE
ncbi:MAG: hypothetical protein K2Q12_02270 [Rickettsiales bacterium]|jgi:hypothetical protein|nr:hypothetical protein [Rickettsiales bacterium]